MMQLYAYESVARLSAGWGVVWVAKGSALWASIRFLVTSASH